MISKKQKLELTWIGKVNRSRLQPHLKLLRGGYEESPPGSATHVRVAAPKVCGEPRCRCVSVLLDFHPPIPEGVLCLDLNEKGLIPSPEQKNDPEFLQLDKLLRAELNDADFQRLRDWYFAEKLDVIETTPVSEIEITDLPNATGGSMVGFTEVFPCGLSLNFSLDDEVWATDEQYCVTPECGCTDTVLSFLKLKDAAGKISLSISDPPALYYNYRSQTARPLDAGPVGAPGDDRLLAALKGAHPILDLQLERHHLILQSLYARMRLAQTKSLFKPLVAAASRKIGRNEPCPCGSGKKFKHCCLNLGVQ
ncbi:MAG TPA: SEC-C metal-binding domain-containing protein [Candidatus Sulfotelmatobacter sp.]|nr:SEC-C metal-binding domain-containing protein [Candidatus Sulfotelmatobacter sp.]